MLQVHQLYVIQIICNPVSYKKKSLARYISIPMTNELQNFNLRGFHCGYPWPNSVMCQAICSPSNDQVLLTQKLVLANPKILSPPNGEGYVFIFVPALSNTHFVKGHMVTAAP